MFAHDLGIIRHLTVAPSGIVFVAVVGSTEGASDGHVLALADTDHDGIADQRAMFGTVGGNGIAWDNGRLFVAANDRIVRFEIADGDMLPRHQPEVVVTNLPADGDHPAKAVAIAGDRMFVSIGSATNACQVVDRAVHSRGIDPCPELAIRAGIWQFSASGTGQQPRDGVRLATGLRDTNALALDPRTGTLWGAVSGRDQLRDSWPELFTDEQDLNLPAEEVVSIASGEDFGWPYCYFDPFRDQNVLAPEYGGTGQITGRCANVARPATVLPAHAAPLGMVFATGTQLPPGFQDGAFVANHGSRFDAQGVELHGYDVMFVPFANGMPASTPAEFATGFDAGRRPLPEAAPHRPVGLAMMPDGSLLISDDKGGRIWRVFAK
ncbi:MAG: hypothetical protein JWO36_1261 [Myxococcales bacterium]|nr:hypothetical protein [Myxococcales bacterium]